MRLRLDYGTDGLEVDLPDERVTVIEPVFRPAVPDAHEALLNALRAPIGRPPLRDIVRPGDYIFIPANMLHVAVNRGTQQRSRHSASASAT